MRPGLSSIVSISLALALAVMLGTHQTVLSDETDPPHETHLTADRGPQLDPDCTPCHTGPIDHTDIDTNSCNTCHSPSGIYDGVNDVNVGALNNWENLGTGTGATQSLIYDSNDKLKSGKAKWCAGCHDDVPATVVDSLDDFEGYGNDSALQAVWKN